MSSESISAAPPTSSDESGSFDDVSLYDYDLPEKLIAKEPLPQRDASRLLVLDRQTGEIQHRGIRDLPEFLRPGDCLVLNDTRVLPARLIGQRDKTGGKWEGLYLGQADNGDWRLIGQTRGYLKPGESVVLIPLGQPSANPPESLHLTLIDRESEGVWLMRPEPSGDVVELLEQFGTMPLPPYMHRKIATDTDRQRYQTTYADHPGSVAAPTAAGKTTRPPRPKVKAIGGVPTMTSSFVRPTTWRAKVSAMARMSRWKWTQPLGFPVVPEVKAIRAGSSSAVSTASKPPGLVWAAA